MAKKKNSFLRAMEDTFMEMSVSLAGWIDDASDYFSPAKPPVKNQRKNSSTSARKRTNSTNNDKPKLEK